MFVGRLVPVIVTSPLDSVKVEPVISPTGVIYVTSQVILWHTAGFPSTETINWGSVS